MQTDNPTPEAAMVEEVLTSIQSARRWSDTGPAMMNVLEESAKRLICCLAAIQSAPPPVIGGEGALREALLREWRKTEHGEPDMGAHPWPIVFRALATPATGGTFADGVEARDLLAWLTDKDNLVLSHSAGADAWQVRRANGMIRGEGSTPLAALHAAMSSDGEALQPGAAREDGA